MLKDLSNKIIFRKIKNIILYLYTNIYTTRTYLNLITEIFPSKAKDKSFQSDSNIKKEGLQQQGVSLIALNTLKYQRDRYYQTYAYILFH